MHNKDIFLVNEDFKGFEIGEFPFDREHSAMGEYHLYPSVGNCGIWYDPVTNYNYRGASWIITENDGKHFMEQMRVVTDKPHKMHPMLLTGQQSWKNYVVQTKLRMLHTGGSAGVCVCCQNCLNVVAVVFEEQHLRVVFRHKETSKILAETAFNFNCDDFYALTIDCQGNKLVCNVNGKEVLTCTSDLIDNGGKIAITATMPTQFEYVSAKISKQTADEIEIFCKNAEKDRQKRSSAYPKMKLAKTIDMQDFGCGRQIRFGHLTGDDKWHIVFAQCQKRIHKDAYAKISCLTAIDLEGNILWQRGTPSKGEEFGLLSADLPLQVYDIDGDGFDEVITAIDFEVLILDGRTGQIKKRARTPLSIDDGKLIGVPFEKYAFDRLNPDGIRIANLSGKDRPTDIILKDRYCRLFALDSDLNHMWTFRSQKNTGHFPYTLDINGDGREEIFCGYNLIDADGKLIWTLPIEVDHTDEIVAGRFLPDDDELYFGLACGTQGFVIADSKGNIFNKDGIGHAQRISVANYCNDKKGFEFCLTNFWGHNSVVYLYDCFGKPLWELETQLNGNIIAPVNWRGDAEQLILLNASPTLGGLIDGDGVRVVTFPEDNHPQLCVEAIDLLGDSRDELVVWDKHKMYIYTQEDNPKQNVFAPIKYPHFNASNYRGEYSLPNADLLKPKFKK